MMTWLLLAIGGHIANAAAFLVDKMLLSQAFKRSATYAVLMGGLSTIVIVASPWVSAWPDRSLFPYVLAFGGCFVFALWAFFEAMRREEASRVVPIVGALVPLFTLLGESLFLGGVLSSRELIGFLFLVLSTILFTRGSHKRSSVSWKVIGFSALAAFLFASASLNGKFAFDHAPFVGVLILSRLCGFVTALLIALIADTATRTEIRNVFFPAKKKTKKQFSLGTKASAIIGQLLGGAGFICVHLAMIQGSAAIVNALQAVQYGILVLLAWIGGSHLRKILNEETSSKTLLQKGIGILAVATGLWFLTQS